MHTANLMPEHPEDVLPPRLKTDPPSTTRREDSARSWRETAPPHPGPAGARAARNVEAPGASPEPIRYTGPAAFDVEAQLASCAHAHAPVRRVMAELAARLLTTCAWERLGFARLRDYATERLGLSARSLHDLAHIHQALALLPQIDTAFTGGEITWTKVRLLVRAARPGSEGQWLTRAHGMTASALSREVRAVDVGSVERNGLTVEVEEDDAERNPCENVQIRCSSQVQGKWHRARQLAWRVAGRPVRPWECAEMIAAEVLSAIPMDIEEGSGLEPVPHTSAVASRSEPGRSHEQYSAREAADATILAEGEQATFSDDKPSTHREHEHATAQDGAQVSANDPRGGETRPLDAAPDARADEPAASARPPELPAFLKSLVTDLGNADEFELDRRLRSAVAFEQRLDAEVGSLLFRVVHERLYRSEGAAGLDDYARERLGISPRKVRALLRLERASFQCPALAQAYREGRLSWVQANALVPVLIIPHGQPRSRAWVDWAAQVSVRRLQDDVDSALVLNETDPQAFAATGGLPAAARGANGRGINGPAAAGQAANGHRANAHGASESRNPISLPDPPADRQIGAQRTASQETSLLFFHAPREVAQLFRAVLSTVQRSIERQTQRSATQGEAFEAMLEHVFDVWGGLHPPNRATYRVFERDGWRCTVPACSSYRNLHDHHIVFRSAGGSNDLANRTTLCAWHHLRGVHAGIVRCDGGAPDDLRFELGLRRAAGPLLSFGAGERLARWC